MHAHASTLGNTIDDDQSIDISVSPPPIWLIAEVRLSPDEQDGLDYLREAVDSCLSRSHYCTVSLKKLFQPFHSVPDLDESVMEVGDQEEEQWLLLAD